MKRARAALHPEESAQEKIELDAAKRLLNDARSLGFNDNDEVFRRLNQQIRTCEKIASVADKLVAVRVRTRLAHATYANRQALAATAKAPSPAPSTTAAPHSTPQPSSSDASNWRDPSSSILIKKKT